MVERGNMNAEIIVGILSLTGTLGGSYLGVMASSKLTNYRIEQLEKKVDKHNTVIERTYALEKATTVTDEQIKVINHRISDLEEKR